MKGLENQSYVWLLIISNAIALFLLFAAWKWPRVSRFSFFLLFAWASWMNAYTSQQSPQSYLEYGELSFVGWYRDFIYGWFSRNIENAVGFVAICQAFISVSMLLKGWIFRLGSIGAIIFFLAILPLGVGSGFPCTAIMATAMFILLRKHSNNFVWQPIKDATMQTPATS